MPGPASLWQNDRVDDVDDSVARLDVGLDDVRAADAETGEIRGQVGSGWGQVSTPLVEQVRADRSQVET